MIEAFRVVHRLLDNHAGCSSRLQTLIRGIGHGQEAGPPKREGVIGPLWLNCS
jgi:hypothetical protein